MHVDGDETPANLTRQVAPLPDSVVQVAAMDALDGGERDGTAASDPAAPAKSQSSKPGTTPSTGRRRVARVARWVFASALILGIVGSAGVLLAIALSQESPGWWRTLDPQDAGVQRIARAIENGAVTELTRVRASAPANAVVDRASEPWTVRIRGDDASAWLAARLRPWLESQENAKFNWPGELEQVQVTFTSGLIVVGARVQAGGKKQVLSASIRPELRSDGGLWLPARWVSVGRLSMPASWVLRGGGRPASRPVQEALPETVRQMPQLKEFSAALVGEIPVLRSAIVRIGDGRSVRILAIRANDDELLLTCQTLPRETARVQTSPGK